MPRQSAAVYRRRRLLVILLVLIVLAAAGAGTWLAIAQPWADATGSAPKATQTTPAPEGDASSSATPNPGAPETPDPEASETPAIVACTAADVTVAAHTDADTYAPDDEPQLSITLTNTGDQDCTMNVGSSTQKFTVTSGSDVWWRSTDCQTEPSDMIVTLQAGKSVTSATPVVWDRTRSSVDTCDDKTRPRAPGGGASYHVKVAIGGFESAASKQIILR